MSTCVCGGGGARLWKELRPKMNFGSSAASRQPEDNRSRKLKKRLPRENRFGSRIRAREPALVTAPARSWGPARQRAGRSLGFLRAEAEAARPWAGDPAQPAAPARSRDPWCGGFRGRSERPFSGPWPLLRVCSHRPRWRGASCAQSPSGAKRLNLSRGLAGGGSHSAGGRPGPIPHRRPGPGPPVGGGGRQVTLELSQAGAQAPPCPAWWRRARPVAGSRGASASTPGPAEAARNAGVAEDG